MKKRTKLDNEMYQYWNDFILVATYLSGVFGISIAIF